MCVERAFGMLKDRWRILLKMIDMQLKNISELMSTCLVLHNICMIFCDNFWNTEWVQEATDDVHNGLTTGRVSGASSKEKLVAANHALHSLACIDEGSRETLEDITQNATREYQITNEHGREDIQRTSCKEEWHRKKICRWRKQKLPLQNVSYGH